MNEHAKRISCPSSLVPIPTEVAAERRMYLPLVAVIVLVVTGVRAIGVQSPFFHPERFLHEAGAHEHAESVAAWVDGYLATRTR